MWMTPTGFAITVVSSFLGGVFATIGFAFWLSKKLGLGDE